MKYKFVDIGCCFFDTSLDRFGLDVPGLLVEPVKMFFDILPCSDLVKKVNVAISDQTGTTSIFVPNALTKPDRYKTKQDVIDLFNNESGQGVGFETTNYGGSTLLEFKKFGIESTPEECQTITLEELCDQYDITEIDYLKIDVEGYEPVILKQLVDLMSTGRLKINCEIMFEYNFLSDKDILDEYTKTIADNFNFSAAFVKEYWNEDIVLTKNVVAHKLDKLTAHRNKIK